MVNLEQLSNLLSNALAKETEQTWNERYERYLADRYGIYTSSYNATNVCASTSDYGVCSNGDASEHENSYFSAA